MDVFVSYAREDSEAVRTLNDDVKTLGHDPWFDRDTPGAAQWWETVLRQIRVCEAFLLALSPDWLESRACQAELRYALDLERPIVPVLVRAVDMSLVHEAVARANYVDLRTRGVEAVLRLARALAELPEAGPLPDPLPDPPPVPMTNLGTVGDQLRHESLGSKEQSTILHDLLEHLNIPDDRDTVVELLQLLRSRSDVTRAVADDIDETLRSVHARSRRVTSGLQQFTRWTSLRLSVEGQRCTPVLGPGLTDSLIGPRRVLAREWAETFGFPMATYQAEDLPQVAQYVKVQNDVPTLRNALSSYLRRRLMSDYPEAVTTDLGQGRLDEMLTQAWQHRTSAHTANDHAGGAVEPHVFLAQLPLPVYVTAHASNLLTHALVAAGRNPVVELCRWSTDVDEWPESALSSRPTYEPSVAEPLVFHLFGNLDVPDSLVLTEDDYFDFLINVTRHRTVLIPTPVLAALTDSALMFLGFGVEQWDFRVLLRSLVSPEGGKQRHAHVAAQFDLGESVISAERARRYLESYFADFKHMTIDICWSSVDEFLTELSHRWRDAA